MNPNTGGPAFPQHGWTKDPEVLERMRNQGGMTLIDWMAGQALAGMYANPELAGAGGIVECAYDIASAMLAEKARREATGKQDLQIDDHFRDATKMIPGGFAEDTLRRLAHDVLHSDIKDAAEEAPLTWCAEQVRARVNTLEALNRELVNALEKFIEAGFGFSTSPAMRAEAYNKACEILAKAKEVA